jgi:acyl-homoserine lactone acylase PvdQ
MVREDSLTRKGNIGYWMTGKVPIRNKKSIALANYPKDGFDLSCEWQGFVPSNELPHVLNPKNGFVVSANHNILNPKVDYKYFLGNCWKAGYRADRITELIKTTFQKNGKITVEDCKRMQLDEVDNSDISKYLSSLKLDFDSLYEKSNDKSIPLKEIKNVFNAFCEWDGVANIKSIGACISIVFTNVCTKNAVKSTFGEELVKAVLGCGFSANSVSEFHSHESEILIELFNGMKEEKRNELIILSLMDTIRKIRQLIPITQNTGESEVLQYEYGKIHQLTFRHAFGSKISAFNRF